MGKVWVYVGGFGVPVYFMCMIHAWTCKYSSIVGVLFSSGLYCSTEHDWIETITLQAQLHVKSPTKRLVTSFWSTTHHIHLLIHIIFCAMTESHSETWSDGSSISWLRAQSVLPHSWIRVLKLELFPPHQTDWHSPQQHLPHYHGMHKDNASPVPLCPSWHCSPPPLTPT